MATATVGGALAAVRRWLDAVVLGLARDMRWSYLPPLMVYFAAGVSGLTAIVGTFFVKEHLGLSAAFLAGLSFWAGIPWTLKLPLGHLVDLIWRWKAALVYLGAAVIAASILIMYALIAHTDAMAAILPIGVWYVAAALLAPVGYVIQDVVADAMTVEAVPPVDASGRPYTDAETKSMHTTMQTLGRFAIIGGVTLVAVANIVMFSDVESLSEAQKTDIYARIYLAALVIPALSILGVTLGALTQSRRAARLRAQGATEERIAELLAGSEGKTEANWWILGGGLAFAVFTLGVGLAEPPFSQEIVFAGSLAVVLFLMRRLLTELDADAARALVGTAVIIFVFRATPSVGPGATWFEIDVLGFDQQFLSVLSFITYGLALVGMVLLRPLMASRPIADLVMLLTLAGGVLALPNLGLYYGVQEWTAAHTGGIVDARFIAVLDTAIESPLGQIAMVPMLAWIARNAPKDLKATFFAVMASFTNLALSASSLGSKYLNQIFLVTREVRDRETGAVAVPADYSELGWLLITAVVISVALPAIAILVVQRSRWRTTD